MFMDVMTRTAVNYSNVKNKDESSFYPSKNGKSWQNYAIAALGDSNRDRTARFDSRFQMLEPEPHHFEA